MYSRHPPPFARCSLLADRWSLPRTSRLTRPPSVAQRRQPSATFDDEVLRTPPDEPAALLPAPRCARRSRPTGRARAPLAGGLRRRCGWPRGREPSSRTAGIRAGAGRPRVARPAQGRPRTRPRATSLRVRWWMSWLSLQCLAQEHPCPVQLRLAAACRDRQLLGDFLVLEAFDVVQDEDFSRSRGQHTNRLFQVYRQSRCFRPGGQRCFKGLVIFFVLSAEALPIPSFCLPGVQHDVHGQPVQPGPKRAVATEEREFLPRPDEDVLRQLFRS